MSLMDRSPRRDKAEEEIAFQRKVSRGQTPTPPKFNRCQLMVGDRLMAGITMALPFVVCFTTFGIFNLIAGSILTSMAWKPTNGTWDSLAEIPKPRDKFERLKREKFLDPLKVMGPILLITGVMLVLVGFALGLTACRSVYASRDPSKSSMITHYTAAIQLSGFNGHNSYAGMPWTVVPGKNPAVATDAAVVTAAEGEKKMEVDTTEVTIEMGTPATDVKTESETNKEGGDGKSESESSGSSRGEESPVRNKVDKEAFSGLDSTPGCSYFEGQGLATNVRPHLFGRGGGQRSDSLGLWDSETCFLVPPYDLNPETYIT